MHSLCVLGFVLFDIAGIRTYTARADFSSNSETCPVVVRVLATIFVPCLATIFGATFGFALGIPDLIRVRELLYNLD